jgi:hypothetical protein
MAFDPISAALDIGGKVIDRLFPDPTQASQAKLELLKLQQSGDLQALVEQNKAANAEAASADPWTSRARPSFLYVMYILILASIPMGFLAAFRPDIAKDVAQGMQAWLASIPDALWQVFGLCFSVYAGGRTWEKLKGVAK